jgi:hypothetical protein
MNKIFSGLAILAASTRAFDFRFASFTLAESKVTHLVPGGEGEAPECPLPFPCTSEQYQIRTNDADNCSCRYYEQECCGGYAFDSINGECVCLAQACPSDHEWNYDSCNCECVAYSDCPQINGKNAFWDPEDCMCKCIPQPDLCEEGQTWSINECECVNIKVCEEPTPYLHVPTNECVCAPEACEKG